jgi:peptidoglycan hydrolase-like protein with peptidoglycan-binding domain
MPAPEPTPAAAAASLPNPAAAAERQRLQNVQNILNRIGYGPLAANGESTEETANAIRRFELDNGLPITGAPNDRVLSRLTAIGASGSG